MTESLAEAYPREQSRVRELVSIYEAIGHPGTFAAMMLKDVLCRAEAAAASGDLAEMILMFNELKGCE